jgi:hypothetical protein
VQPDAPPSPGFVARDRIRRFAWNLDKVIEERRWAWEGERLGMATLSDRSVEALTEIDDDVTRAVDDVLQGRAQDRERAYMEMPFVVAAQAVAVRIRLARDLVASGGESGPNPERRQAFLEMLRAARRRIDAYCEAYDAKRPAGPARSVEVARLLEVVERERDAARGRTPAAVPFDRAPPAILSDPHVLEDLIVLARDACAPTPGPWRVRLAERERPLEIALGDAKKSGEVHAAPPAVDRAHRVLSFVHPVEAFRRAPPDDPDACSAIVLRLADPAAGSLSLAVAAAAGDGARLTPEAERAVRALLQAPPLPERGPLPPARLVALLGVLRALDTHLERILLPRLRASPARVGASRVPREDTRKAPPRRDFLDALGERFPPLAVQRLDALSTDVAQGKVNARACHPGDAAVLLAVLARTWTHRGMQSPASVDLVPLGEADVEALIGDLAEIAQVRREMEAGRDVAPVDITRLERDAVAVLGRLGRVVGASP